MIKRDLAILAGSVAVGGVGIAFTLLGYTDLALLVLLVLGIILVILLMLQRRQLGILQQRTLKLLRKNTTTSAEMHSNPSSLSEDQVEVAIHIATKKVLGILHAQQTEISTLTRELTSLRTQFGPDESAE